MMGFLENYGKLQKICTVKEFLLLFSHAPVLMNCPLRFIALCTLPFFMAPVVSTVVPNASPTSKMSLP